VLAPLAIVTGCKSGASTATTGPPEVGAEGQCKVDANCVVSCAREGDCCGVGYQCTNVQSAAEHTRINEKNRAACPSDRPDDCPVYDCPMPTHDYLAVCQKGACVAEKRPLERE